MIIPGIIDTFCERYGIRVDINIGSNTYFIFFESVSYVGIVIGVEIKKS